MAIREHLFHRRIPSDPLFRWRGGEVSRLEGLSDGVFALTITLLVVSLDVPVTWLELRETIRAAPVFLASFAILMVAWRYHDSFFRRYGLADLATTALNSAFLFLVVFYAFPLKFLATFLWHVTLGERAEAQAMFPESAAIPSMQQRGELMLFYGLGVVGVFGLLGAMLGWAWHKRDVLDLDGVERALTLASLRAHWITAGLAAVSVVVVLAGAQPGVAGIVYFGLVPAHLAHAAWSARAIRQARVIS